MLVGEYRVRQVVGVALWHLEAGVKFRVKIKPQEMQPKMWSTPFWKHELPHWVPNPCSINSRWPGEQSPSLSPSVCPSSRLSCLQITWPNWGRVDSISCETGAWWQLVIFQVRGSSVSIKRRVSITLFCKDWFAAGECSSGHERNRNKSGADL